MAPSYKLYYFDTPGRAEVIRIMFHYAGVEFEDFRIPREEWPKLKQEMPFGQVPVLEIDGSTKLSQSHAISRYLAREFGLTGSSEWDAARCDQYVDCFIDLLQHMIVWKYSGKSEEEKEAARKTLYETALPALFERLNKAVEKNPSGLLVCDKITWADIYLSFTVEALRGLNPTFDFGPYAAVLDVQTKVMSDPKLQAYLAARKAAA